jgi:hypothetical protein
MPASSGISSSGSPTVGALIYKGGWRANTNDPTLADNTGTLGWMYRVAIGGTIDLGSGAITYDAGDYVIHNGTTWEKDDAIDKVMSVNGDTGVVSLSLDDVVQVSGTLTAGSSISMPQSSLVAYDGSISARLIQISNTSNAHIVSMNASTLTSSRVITWPDQAGTVGILNLNLSATAGQEAGFTIAPTVNQSLTANYAALLIASTEGSVSPSTNYLIRATVDTGDRFRVRTTGLIEGAGLSNATSTSQGAFTPATTGPQISRNISDANPALLVTQSHASSTGDILRLANSGGNVLTVSRAGSLTMTGGGIGLKRTTVNDANYSILVTDYMVCVTAITADRTLTLPDATTHSTRRFLVMDETGQAGPGKSIILATVSGQRINGVLTQTISTGYGFFEVYSNGSNWFIINRA